MQIILIAVLTFASQTEPDVLDLRLLPAQEFAKVMQTIYKPRTPDSGPQKGTLQDTQPEEWTVDNINTLAFQEKAKRVKVYYQEGESLDDVKSLTMHREPVNIDMIRVYDEKKLEHFFGYSQTSYKIKEDGKLMPNLAIFTPTQIVSNDNIIENLNVINLIGAGFDVPEQPDFQYFLQQDGEDFKPERYDEFVQRMGMMYRFAFHHAQTHGLKYIQHIGVGEGNFGGKVAGQVKEIRLKVISALAEEYDTVTVVQDNTFFVPKNLFERPEGWHEDQQIDNTLFVNAWDPHSMVGNGNKGDFSADGFWGRISNMAYLAWPFTNPFMEYVAVPENFATNGKHL